VIRLQDISIDIVEATQPEAGLSANVLAILHEIASLQVALVEDNETGSIDLHGLPLLPGERDALHTVLGEGEIRVTIDALGPTRIHETRLAGVWWVQHQNREGERIAELIEVTRCPAIMKSDARDIAESARALREQLAEWSSTSAIEEGESHA